MTTTDTRPPGRDQQSDRALRHFAVWCIVCWIAAGPSFILGTMIAKTRPEQLLAMAMGVFIFAGLYTRVSIADWFGKLRRRPFVERTLKIGYGLRLAQSFLSIIPPLFILDIFPGMISLGIANLLLGEGRSFEDGGFRGFSVFLLATLIQGCLLNVILLVLMLIIQRIQRAFCTPPPTGPTGFCPRCKYDLRASKGVCPECGEPIVEAAVDSAGTVANRL